MSEKYVVVREEGAGDRIVGRAIRWYFLLMFALMAWALCSELAQSWFEHVMRLLHGSH